MGGIVSVLISILALVAFMASGNFTMSLIALVVALICAESVLHMRYFSRIIARDRLYYEAMKRGDFEHDSPEAERY